MCRCVCVCVCVWSGAQFLGPCGSLCGSMHGAQMDTPHHLAAFSHIPTPEPHATGPGDWRQANRRKTDQPQGDRPTAGRQTSRRRQVSGSLHRLGDPQATNQCVCVCVCVHPQVKCHQYWPNPSYSGTYGCYQLSCLSEEGNGAYTVREMTLSNTEVS